MITITGYKKVEYNGLQKALKSSIDKNAITIPKIAVDIGVKSTETIKNAMRLDGQIASDKVLCKVMEAVGVDGLIVYSGNEKYYYIKSK